MSRYIPFALVVLLTAVSAALGFAVSAAYFWALVALGPLTLLGLWNLLQRDHTLMRLYPISAHVRWVFEWLRPYMRQYVLESDREGRPFDHDQRAIVYKRSKDIEGVQPFGTEIDVYSPLYEWINHAIQGKAPGDHTDFRVRVGGEGCTRPYDASVLNISAMSFGSLSGRAIEAFNMGAAMGGFYHDTGEGAISRYHRLHGGDLVWEIGTGYFGCRTKDGRFDLESFADKAQHDQVKMIEVKLSQGAKPGHGGLLPGSKVTAEIAAARDVKPGLDVISPPYHSAFSTPTEMVEWLATLRERSGGKPVGFKLCIGHYWEFLAIVKAILKTGITPDFIVVDGAEGGTGAAPSELSDHVGTPLREGLVFVVNALVGTGLRERIRVAAAGKVYNGHTLAANIALGADWCNAARSFMFALGCVQTQKCHTDHCPTGVATQNRLRQRGLVVADKGPRVYRFHKNTVAALAHYVAAAGLDDPWQLRPHHLRVRLSENAVRSADSVYGYVAQDALLEAPDETRLARWWAMADADSFAPRC